MKNFFFGMCLLISIGRCPAMYDEKNIQFSIIDSSNAADFSYKDAFLRKTVKFNFSGLWYSEEAKLNLAVNNVWNPLAEGHKKIIMAYDEQKQDFDFIVIDSIKSNDDCLEIHYFGFDPRDEKILETFINKLANWQDRLHEIVITLDVCEVNKLKKWLSNNYFFEEECEGMHCWATPKTFKRPKNADLMEQFPIWP